jgi:hypothetical protein
MSRLLQEPQCEALLQESYGPGTPAHESVTYLHVNVKACGSMQKRQSSNGCCMKYVYCLNFQPAADQDASTGL